MNRARWPTGSAVTSWADRWWMTSPTAMKNAAQRASRAAISAFAIDDLLSPDSDEA